jgi:PT repeat family protein
MMPTTDASNPVTSTVTTTTGAGQASTSQQNPQSMDFDFDLDFSDTTQNPVSDFASVDQDVQSAQSVGVQNSEETASPDAHSDLDFSLDLPDSYTGDASENGPLVQNVESSQVVDQVAPVEVPEVEAHSEVSEPDFGSLLNEEQSPDPVSSEPVEAPVESALENDLEPVEEATNFQSEEQPVGGDEEALESEEPSNQLTSEVVAEPIAEVDEEPSEGLSDGESDLEFSPEDFEDDTLPMAEEDSFSEDDEETTPVFENEITPEGSGSMFSSEASPVEEATPEMEENSDFTLENQTESSAFSSPYEGENAQAEVQSFQPSEEVQVGSTIDPFEAMKVSLEPENTVESQSSIQMSSENTTPMMENALHEEVSTVNNETYESQTPVAPLVQNVDVPSPTLDTPMQTQTEQAQPSAFQQGVSLDTLVAQTPVQEISQVQESVSQAQATPQMLSLDEMLAQPAAQVPQQAAPVMDLTSLTVGAQNSTNPLTNPTAYPTVQTAGNDGLMKKVLAGVGGIVLVALAGVMVYIKYPLMFGSGGDTPQQPTTQSGTIQPQLALNTSGDQADHFAAGQEGENIDQNSLVS